MNDLCTHDCEEGKFNTDKIFLLYQQDQKKLHEQSVNEQETSSGSKPSQNARTPSKKGGANSRSNGNSAQVTRRLSLHGGGMTQQEALLLAKPNGTTPVRNGSSAPNKDIRFNSPGKMNVYMLRLFVGKERKNK